MVMLFADFINTFDGSVFLLLGRFLFDFRFRPLVNRPPVL